MKGGHMASDVSVLVRDKQMQKQNSSINNRRAFAIHGTVTLICMGLAIVMTLFSAFLSPPIWQFGILAVLSLYIRFGYCYLIPLPKSNLLSVSSVTALSLFLVGFLFTGTLVGGSQIEVIFDYWWAVNLIIVFNLPAIFGAGVIYELFTQSNPAFNSLPFSLYCIAAFVPSLLMYVGLCLKRWKQGKEAAVQNLEK
ncbi:MAG: hypothetical protein FWD93_01385 [Coriobacteriia bacterium]|nr:hypothetical protein [Coriobacteriia bacterium]